MSTTTILGGRCLCTVSIHWPGKSARAARFAGLLSHLVSKRPIWLADTCAPASPTEFSSSARCARPSEIFRICRPKKGNPMTEDELLTAIENTMQAAHQQCQPYFLKLAKLCMPDVPVARTQIYLG